MPLHNCASQREILKGQVKLESGILNHGIIDDEQRAIKENCPYI